MSLFHPLNLVCPNCQAALVMSAVGSINADRRPDYRQAILDDKFQDVTCPKCNETSRLQPQFNYLDVAMGQWIGAMPAAAMADYLSFEDEVTAVFETSYGKSAPAAARSVGDGLSLRLTFGWPAVREKILARAEGLDDVLLEILKLEMLRAMPEAPMKPGVELRLISASATDLVFAWVRSDAEGAAGSGFVVERAVYDNIRDRAGDYEALAAELTNGPFVDMQKLYLGAGRGALPPTNFDAELAELE